MCGSPPPALRRCELRCFARRASAGFTEPPDFLSLIFKVTLFDPRSLWLDAKLREFSLLVDGRLGASGHGLDHVELRHAAIRVQERADTKFAVGHFRKVVPIKCVLIAPGWGKPT